MRRSPPRSIRKQRRTGPLGQSDSGAKGTFGAVGNPFVVKDEICRMFVAQVSVKGPEDWLQGNACRIGPGEWTIREARPWKRPG